MPKSQIEEYWEKLDRYGEERVRQLLAQGAFNENHRGWAEAWVEKLARHHEATAQERQELRADEALDASREANRLSRYSNWIALAALLVAFAALYFSTR